MASVSKREWTYNGEMKTAWVVRYKDEKGVHRQRTFEKKKDADKYRDKVKREIEDGFHVAHTEKVSIEHVCNEYYEACKRRHLNGALGRSSMRGIEVIIRLHIKPKLGKVAIVDLEEKHVIEWIDYMKRKGISSSTISRYARIFGAVEEYAVKKRYTNQKIVRSSMREEGIDSSAKIRRFSQSQIALIMADVKVRVGRKQRRAFLMFQLYVYLAVFCTLRFGEISGLTLQNIDFENRIIRVRHNLTMWDELKSPKTRSGVREAELPEMVANALREWVDTYYVDNPRQLVFRTAQGGFYHPRSLHVDQWRPMLKRTGLWAEGEDCYHFHSLRHFAGSLQLHHGIPIAEVSRRMGHANPGVTLRVYAHEIDAGNKRHGFFDQLATSMEQPSEVVSQGLRNSV